MVASDVPDGADASDGVDASDVLLTCAECVASRLRKVKSGDRARVLVAGEFPPGRCVGWFAGTAVKWVAGPDASAAGSVHVEWDVGGSGAGSGSGSGPTATASSSRVPLSTTRVALMEDYDRSDAIARQNLRWRRELSLRGGLG